MPVWWAPSNGTNAVGGRRRRLCVPVRVDGCRRARTDDGTGTGTQRPGDERAAGDAGAPRPLLGHDSFRTPATWDRFSDSPASCAFSASTVCGSTVTRACADGYGSSSGRRAPSRHPGVAAPGWRRCRRSRSSILPSSAGSASFSAGLQLVDGGLRTLQVGVEVPQVGLGVAVLLAGDLALGHLFDQLGGAERHVESAAPRAAASARSAWRCPCRAYRRTARRPRWCSSRTAGTRGGASR